MNINLVGQPLLRSALQITLLAREWWLRLKCVDKLAAAASAAVCCGLAFAGDVATINVRNAILDHSTASTALYMDSVVAPHVQELAVAQTLSESSRQALSGLLTPTAIGKPIVSFRIWKDNRVVFSNDRNLIGRHFAQSATRDWAFAGHLAADLDELDGDDDIEIRALGVSALEIYAPVHETGTGRIIALVETYQIAGDLRLQIWTVQALIWLMLGLVATGTSAFLLLMARAADRNVPSSSWQGEGHRARVSAASRRVLEKSELHLRQVGTDLYDGPVQLVGLALLRLDTLHEQIAELNPEKRPYAFEIDRIRCVLDKALDDIRSLCSGLVPSKIKVLSLADTLRLAARSHEQRTGKPVACSIHRLPPDVPFFLKACIFRFVRDGLGSYSKECNWYAICAATDESSIEIRVLGSSAAPDILDGVAHSSISDELRDRVEALGGALFVQSALGLDSITARFTLSEVDVAHG